MTIYNVNLCVEDKKNKTVNKKNIYLTADTKKQLYDRCSSQYKISKDNVEILEEIDEDSIDINGGK